MAADAVPPRMRRYRRICLAIVAKHDFFFVRVEKTIDVDGAAEAARLVGCSYNAV